MSCKTSRYHLCLDNWLQLAWPSLKRQHAWTNRVLILIYIHDHDMMTSSSSARQLEQKSMMTHHKWALLTRGSASMAAS